MSKFHWKRGELEKIDKGVKQYNKAINILKKMGYSEEQLPEKKNYYTERDKIISNNENPREYVNDLMKMIKVMGDRKNFQSVKSERGLELPKATKKIIEIEIKGINRERERLKNFYSQFEQTDRGEKIHKSNERDFETEFRPKKFNFDNMSKRDFEKFKQTLGEYDKGKAERERMYRENFYKGIFNTEQLTEEDKQKLKEIIDKIPTDELLKQFYTDIGKNKTISFLYEPADREEHVEALLEMWNNVALENNNE